MKRVLVQVPLLALSLFFCGQNESFAQLPQQSVEAAGLSLPPQTEGKMPDLERASILGTVAGTDDQPVAGATVSLLNPQLDVVRTATTDGLGFFVLDNLEPGISYEVAIKAVGFANWQSPPIILKSGQREVIDVGKLRIEELQTIVTVRPEGAEEIAIEQVKVAEKQRGFGVIPNFFAVYDPHPAPLNARLKFNLAFRVLRDPFTLGGIALIAGVGQAADHPAYVQGLKGYGERFGATYVDQFTSIMIGGAILPSVLRQDPRYFYQGTGTKKSRAIHALSDLFITKGDNGRLEPNLSSLGGDLASAAIATTYYPERDERTKFIFESFAINTAVHAAVRLLQEFVFRPAKGTVVSTAGNSLLQ